MITFIYRKIMNLFKKSSDTTIDTDIHLTPLQLIKKYGYPAESHLILSPDGYILELHRIPHGKTNVIDTKGFPILLHHGVFGSSADWIIKGPKNSLVFRLADQGYDVWMMNTRGNPYSMGHIKYTTTQTEYWDFSFHEIGIYDLPTAIDYIIDVTKHKQIVHIGHSLGTTAFYVMASSLAEYNEKIKFHISLAPAVFFTNLKSLFPRFLIRFSRMSEFLFSPYKGVFLKNSWLSRSVRMIYRVQKCFKVHLLEYLFITLNAGHNPDQFDYKLVPIVINNYPASTGSKIGIHFSQSARAGRFQYFDYGVPENIKKYQTAIPPEYDLSLIKIPTRLYYGNGDLISTPQDTTTLYEKIPLPLGLVRINHHKFTHVDFFWAKDVNRLLNDDLIKFIKDCTDYEHGLDFIQNTVKEALQERASTNTLDRLV